MKLVISSILADSALLIGLAFCPIGPAFATGPVPVSPPSATLPDEPTPATIACPTTNYSPDEEIFGSGVITFNCDRDTFPFALASYLHDHRGLDATAITPLWPKFETGYAPSTEPASYLVVLAPR